jgi:hypothetical protein
MKSEMSTYRDRLSGVTVTQLTGYRGHSHHFYFTNRAGTQAGRNCSSPQIAKIAPTCLAWT